jgi:hypothetical protein
MRTDFAWPFRNELLSTKPGVNQCSSGRDEKSGVNIVMGWGLLVEVDSSNDISTRNPAHLTGPADFLNSGLRTQLSYISRSWVRRSTSSHQITSQNLEDCQERDVFAMSPMDRQ